MIIMHALMQGMEDYSDAVVLGVDVDRSLASAELYSHDVVIFEVRSRHQKSHIFGSQEIELAYKKEPL